MSTYLCKFGEGREVGVGVAEYRLRRLASRLWDVAVSLAIAAVAPRVGVTSVEDCEGAEALQTTSLATSFLPKPKHDSQRSQEMGKNILGRRIRLRMFGIVESKVRFPVLSRIH